MHETWIHIYDQEAKGQSREWRSIDSPRQKKFKTQTSTSNVLVSVFWNKVGILLVDYLENYATITAKYYTALLNKLKQQLPSKRRSKLLKGILFLQDSAFLTRRPLHTVNWQIFTSKF
jgi:hypothetical protein